MRRPSGRKLKTCKERLGIVQRLWTLLWDRNLVKAFCGQEGMKATVRDGAALWADRMAHLRERAAKSSVMRLARAVCLPAIVKCHGAKMPEVVN